MQRQKKQLFFYSLLLFTFELSLFTGSTQGQPVTADSTLPVPSAPVCSGNSCVINNGTTAGGNLFHSFTQFSVPTGGEVYFDNNPAVVNIISRVTGISPSNIDGLIRANGTANVFLLNPNGVILGQNARLEIGGSFLASTASAIKFANGFEFSATTPQTPLLTINTPLGLQFGTNTGQIQVQGSNLAVAPGKTLALVGGDLTLVGSQLNSVGGRIELGAVESPSLVNLSLTDNNLTLDYSAVQNFRDIGLSGGAAVNVSGEGGGNIQVQGNHLRLSEGSSLVAVTLGGQSGGTISVNAKESVELTGIGGYEQSVLKFVTGNVSPDDLRSGLFAVSLGAGSAGDIQINTRQFTARNGAFVATTTFNTGEGGNIFLQAPDFVELQASFIATGSSVGTVKDAGDLTINTGRFLARENGLLSTSSLSTGQGGTLTVNASESVELIGSNPIQLFSNVRVYSGFFSSTLGAGPAGDLQVNTRRLVVQSGGGLAATTFNQGDGGNIIVNAVESVELIGNSPDNLTVSSIAAITEPGSAGQGGNITINTGKLSLTNGAEISTAADGIGKGGNLYVGAESVELSGTSADGQRVSGLLTRTSGSGDAGNLTIDTGKLILREGASVSAETRSIGAGGNLTVNARESVELYGSPIPIDNINQVTGIFADSDPKGSTTPLPTDADAGSAGNVLINTGKLIVRDGAEIGAGTFGNAQGGDLTVNASESVEVIGVSPDTLKFPSSLYVDTYGDSNAGKLMITTGQLMIRDGAQVSSGTFAQGNGGSVSVNARSIQLSGSSPSTPIGSELFFSINDQFPSGLITSSVADGAAGNVEITTGALSVEDGAVVAVSSAGLRNAGNLGIAARSISLANQGAISATTASGEGGNITLETQDYVLMRNASQISTTAGGNGNGGNITINAPFIVAVPSEDSDITANAFRGRGGNINITTSGIYGLEFRDQLSPESDITASSQFGVNGVVEISILRLDPSQGLTNLPAEFVNPDQMVARSCLARRRVQQSSFTITGTGGLPPTPYDFLNGGYPVVNLQALGDGEIGTEENSIQHPTSQIQSPLVEAQGWVVNKKGQVVLTASATSATASFHTPPANCPSQTEPML